MPLNRNVSITWFGHATCQIATPGGKKVMVDPWLGGNPACPERLKDVRQLDLILATHGHFDHIGDVVKVALQTKAQVVGIFELCNWLGKKGVEATSAMNKGGTQTVQGIRVTMLHADHSCGITEVDGSIVYGGEAVG